MAVRLEELLATLMREVQKLARSSALAGVPRKFGDSHLVPLCRVSVGFGTGMTSRQGRPPDGGTGGAPPARELEAAGAGGAITVEPTAFVVVDPTGTPRLLCQPRGERAVLKPAIEIRPLADALRALPDKERGGEPGEG